MTQAADIAVLDVGKTNIRLWAACPDGTLLEHESTPNRVLPGPPWRHHDLCSLAPWVAGTLAGFCRRHPIRVVVPVGHGSGGVLVGPDPDAGGTGAALPMIDYEDACPEEIDAEYSRKAGSFEDRGSPVMMATTHAARQLLRMEHADPAAFARARHYLNVAQYWGWWLTGVAASECSAMGAQSQLWNVPRRRWTPIVEERGWQRLMPKFRPAWMPLGAVREPLAKRFELPGDLWVLTGAHDSTANFHRYRAAGLTDFTLVSTGTWIVALSREADIGALDRNRGVTINSDMEGHAVAGALAMGGREFSAVAGPDWRGERADHATLARIVERGTMALPSFSDNEGQFPGSAGTGRIIGPPPETQAERTALALLHSALLTVTCAEVLNGGERLILDGTFLKEPLYAPLVAALRPGRQTGLSDEPEGVVVGAVRLSEHGRGGGAGKLTLDPVAPIDIPGLTDYSRRWCAAAEQQKGSSR